MSPTPRPFLSIPGLLLAGLLAAACTDTATDKPAATGKAPAAPAARTAPLPSDYGDALVDGSIGDASNLLPFLAGDSASSSVSGMVFAGLLRFDKNYDLEPNLAAAWEVSGDQKTLTFHLRSGVTWHDGTPFTADDLVFQYRMMVDPAVPSAYKDTFLQMESATAPDPATFVVTFKEPYSPGLVRVAGMTGLPRHLLTGTKPADLIRSPLARTPVGNGPYRFVEWKSQERIVLKSYDGWIDGRPLVAQRITRVIPDPATQFLELKSGALDMMGLEPLQYLRQTDTADFKKRFNKYRYLANAYTYLGYNLKNPLFADVRVRQALSHAIDRDELIEGVLMGLGRAAAGPIKPGTWAADDDIEPYPYDPERAKKLLAEAGWRDSDGDGTLDKGGKPFSFTIITNQGNDSRKKTGEILQQRFRQIGVAVELRVIEWSAFINSFINKRRFDAVILGWALGPEPDQYAIWHSGMTGEHEFNFVSYANPEVDALLEKAQRTFDRAERTAAYRRFQQILHVEQPYSFLYVPEALPVVASRVRGIDPGPAGIGYNDDRWWIPAGEHLRGAAVAP